MPPEFADLFVDQPDLLASHRGWDAGALELAQQLAQAFSCPLFFSTTTRLLVDLNRSIGHKSLHAPQVQLLSAAKRQIIIQQYYAPHRAAVVNQIDALTAAKKTVLHVAAHSFTPQLNGIVRNADVGLLYDPRRAAEKSFAQCWAETLGRAHADLKVRRNYPYHGKDDGLTSFLRKRIPDPNYIGIELEVNQRAVSPGQNHWEKLKDSIVQSLLGAVSRATLNHEP